VDDSPQSAAWSIRVQYKPFIRWVWLGVLLMAAGVFSASLARRLRRAGAAGAGAGAGASDTSLALTFPT
jgi:cytochrome c-type biogenesis protein CcmF